MTLSDHVIGPAIQASLLHRLGVNEVGGYNFLFLGSFVLCGLTTTWVLRRAGIGLPAAILAGIMFAFSPYRSDQRAHLQVLLMQWIPLMLWLWHRLLEETTPRRAAAFAIVYALHVTGGMYLAYLVHFALAILLLQHLDRWRTLAAWRSLRVLVPTVWCSAALWRRRSSLLTSSPAATYHLERGIGDVGYYGATLLSYLAIGTDNVAWGALLGRLVRPENQLFAGLVATVLAIVGVRLLWLRPRVALARVGGQAMRRLGAGGAGRVVSERERLVLAVLLFLGCVGFLLGDATTCRRRSCSTRACSPAGCSDTAVASPLAVGCVAAWLVLSRRWRGEWPLLPPRCSRRRVGARSVPRRSVLRAAAAAGGVRSAPTSWSPASTGCGCRRAPIRSCRSRWCSSPRAGSITCWRERRSRAGGRSLAMVSVLLVFELRDSMHLAPVVESR